MKEHTLGIRKLHEIAGVPGVDRDDRIGGKRGGMLVDRSGRLGVYGEQPTHMP